MKGSRLKAGAAVLALALGFIGAKEGGAVLSAYLDTGGVATACQGVTRGIRMGMRFTKAQCDAMFMTELLQHETEMRAALVDPDALSDDTYVAVLSWWYNVGSTQARGATLVRLLNAGQVRAACEQLPRWKYDNGRVIRGLVNRRIDERALCLGGLR